MINGVIYTLSDPREPANVRYIGITCKEVETRLYEHLKEARVAHKHTHKLHWIRRLVKEGITPLCKTIEEVEGENYEVLYNKEQELIRDFKAKGYNLVNATDGGPGMHGYKPSEETIAKIKAHPNKPWSKQGEQKRNEWIAAHTKRVTGNRYRRGKADPPELVARKRINMTGSNNPKWNGFVVKMDLQGNEIERWDSIGEAARATHRTHGAIWFAISKPKYNGEPRTCAGFLWKYDKPTPNDNL